MGTNVTRARLHPRDWTHEYAELSLSEGDLPPEDLERYAVAAHLLGKDEQLITLLDRAHRGYLDSDMLGSAARCIFWLVFHLRSTGQTARAAGWLARLHRLLDNDDPDGRLSYLAQLAEGASLMQANAPDEATPLLERAATGARAAGDDDLFVLAGMACGHCLVQQGQTSKALAALDEIMVYVVADQVAAPVVGLAYCSVISICMRRFDVQRAAEWTRALSGWCDAQSGLVPYRGTCQVHRAEIFQLHGSWTEAAEEASRVSQQTPADSVTGAAHYRLAELHRLRGQLDLAERSYAAAASRGKEVQPGLALLRVAQGNPAAGLAGLDRALAESRDSGTRPLMLATKVELALGASSIETAGVALAELLEYAAAIDTPYLAAIAAHSEGQVRLAEDDPQAALPLLRRAWTLWQQVDAPYEAARTRVQVSAACRALGDDDAARMELDAARTVFEQLGARSDLASLAPASGPASAGHPLTARECEVLALVAQGHTNRGIATALFLSEKTVARHLSNIFTKIDVSSRAAATAFAYEHGLV